MAKQKRTLLQELGVKLAQARIDNAITIADLSDKSGISSVTISQLLNGKLINTSVGTVEKICEALQVDVDITVLNRFKA